MAIATTARGTYTNSTAATTSTFSPSGNFAAGSWAALFVSADNASSGGSTNDINTVTDSLGNTWTKQTAAIYDPGAASAGVQGSWFTTPQNAGTLTTSTVITITFGVAPTSDTGILWEVTKAAGETITYVTGGNGTGTSGTALTVTTASVVVGNLTLAGFAMEAGTTQTLSAADTDTTNGSWSTNQYAEIGSTTSGNVSVSQTKVQTTAASTQTYDVTMGISGDYIGSYIVLNAAASATTYSGTFTADAYVTKQDIAGTFTADAIVSKAGIASTFTADAHVSKANISGSMTADAAISKQTSASLTADAWISKTTAAAFTADAQVLGTVASSVTANAMIQKTLSGSLTADSWIKGTLASSFTADTWVKGVVAGTFIANANIQGTVQGSFTADAYVQRTFWFGRVQDGF